MTFKTTPIPNSALGRTKATQARTHAANQHYLATWGMVLVIAHGSDGSSEPPPRTLQGYADRLKAVGYRTRRGEEWTPGTLKRVFEHFSTTPKRLFENYLPQPFVKNRLVDPALIHAALAHVLPTDSHFGRWLPSTAVKPSAGDFVRRRQTDRSRGEARLLTVRRRNGNSVEAYEAHRPSETVKLRLVDLETWRRARDADAKAE